MNYKKTINELIDKVRSATKQAEEILAREDITSDDRETVRQLFNEAHAAKEMAENLSRGAEVNAWLTTPREQHTPETGSTHNEAINPAEVLEKRAFEAYVRNEDVRTLDPEIAQIQKRNLSSASDPDGGYLVPSDFRADVLMALKEANYFRSLARVFTTSRGTLQLPSWAGSITFTKTAQKATTSPQTVSNAFGRTNFTPGKFQGILKASEELVSDAVINISAFLAGEVALQWGAKEEYEFLNGDGNNGPLGILDTNTGLTANDIAGATTVLAPADLLAAPYKLKQSYRRGASWLMPRSTVSKVFAMRTNASGANTGLPLWTQSLELGQPSRLNGFPVLEMDQFPDPDNGSDGDAMFIFGDISRYAIVDRSDLQVKVLNELYAASGEIGYRFTIRIDGGVYDTNAFTRYNRN